MQTTSLLKKALAVGIIFLFIATAIKANISIVDNGTSTRSPSSIMDYNGTLSGHVTDSESTPIKGARVRVYFHDTYRESYSDATGYYHVTDITICNCTKNATCSKEGYLTAWVWLSIWTNTTHEFVLTRANYSLSIGKISGFFWQIGAQISNTGLCNITNITWSIYTYKVTSPFLFGKGKIPILHTGASKYVFYIKPATFGVGWFTILVKVESDYVALVEKSAKAFALYVAILYVQNKGV